MLGPEILIACVGLGGTGVVALFKISFTLGRYESRTAAVLEGISVMLKDHEERIRDLERPSTRR